MHLISILLLTTIAKWPLINAEVNWCDIETYWNDPGKAELGAKIHHWHRTDEYKDACYFYISGATDECNRFDREGNFIFDLALARSICGKYNATLPTVSNKDEMAFIRTFAYHGHRCLVVLGMTKVRGKGIVQAWDDETPPSAYSPEIWEGAETNNYVTVVKTNEPGEQWLSLSEANKYTLHVLCKQRLDTDL